MIEPAFIFSVLLFVTVTGQIIQAIRMASTRQPLTGQAIFFSLSIWAALNAAYHFYKPMGTITVLPIIFSVVSFSCIAIFLHRFLSIHINLPKNQSYLISMSLTGLAVFPLLPINSSLALTLVGFSGIMASLIIALYAERLYHVLKHNNNHHSGLVVGLIGIIGAHFIGFCELILSPNINPHHSLWVAVTTLIFFPMIYRGISRLGHVDVKVCISRPMALHATLFSIAGIYLLGLSGVGFFLQNFAPSWSYTSHLTLMGAATFPLTYVLGSKKIRREVLVWVNKHFFSSQFDYRDTWRMLNEELDPQLHGPAASRQGLVALLSAINHSQGAYYRYVNGTWRSAAMSMSALSHGAERVLFDVMNDIKNEHWIIDIYEAHHTPKNYPMIHHAVKELHDEKVHWVVPAIVNKEIVGVWVVAGDEQPKWSLNWETRDYLSSLVQQVETYIQAQDTRQIFQENAQLAAFHQTSAFVIHDMKNIYAQLSMVNKNAEKHKENPEFIDDMLLSLSSMQSRMDKMLGQLTNKQRSKKQHKDPINLKTLWVMLESDPSLIKHGIIPQFNYQSDLDMQINVNADRLRNIIRHLIDNAQYASKQNQTKSVVCNCRNDKVHVIIDVTDSGKGMSDAFIQAKLFKPFETTKGNAGIGLGVYDAKQFAEQMGGEMTVDSDVEKGTTMTLLLPRSGLNEPTYS
jgi:putative PEP-CTERM system histidine kinase